MASGAAGLNRARCACARSKTAGRHLNSSRRTGGEIDRKRPRSVHGHIGVDEAHRSLADRVLAAFDRAIAALNDRTGLGAKAAPFLGVSCGRRASHDRKRCYHSETHVPISICPPGWVARRSSAIAERRQAFRIASMALMRPAGLFTGREHVSPTQTKACGSAAVSSLMRAG